MAILRDDTKSLILDTAEHLFADYGFDATSLRHIISVAGVNLAAVHYHFGSRESLIEAVLSRRLQPLNEERLELLNSCEGKNGKLTVECVLEALLRPALRLSRDPERGGEIFMRLLGRTYTEPNEQIQKMLAEQFQQVVERFMDCFHKALPELPKEELFWRVHFVIGAMAHTMADTHRLKCMSGGLCDPYDTEGIIRRLVDFSAAGMRLPLKEE
jgi:AcrR family transcriptional regulator